MKKDITHKDKVSTALFFVFYVVLTFGGLLPLPIFYFSSFIESFLSGDFVNIANDFADRGFFGFSPIVLIIISYLILKKIKDTKAFFVSTFFVAACSFYIIFNATGINFSDIKTQILSILYFLLISYTLTLVWKRVYSLNDKTFPYLLLIPVGIMITLGLFVDDFMFHEYILFANFVNQRQFGYYFNILQLDYIGFVIIVSTIVASVVSLALYLTRLRVVKDPEINSG